jgi:DNA-directed RNA polymerase specialized sigma subunit
MRGSLKESIGFDEQQLNYGSVVDQLCRELNILAIDRQILISLLQEGYKSKEIAGMLGISPSAVSQRYHKLLNDKIIG